MAARVKGRLPAPPPQPEAKDQPPPAAKEAHVVVIADVDLISDQFFNLRRERPEGFEAFDFDNVSFVLNCVDTLVGDESFIALRKRRPRHRTLEAVERLVRTYRERNQEQDKKADEEAKEELKKAQAALDAKVEEVRKRTDLDERTKDVMLASIQERENRRFAATKANIEIKYDREKEKNKADRERKVRGLHSRIKALAILLPPLPALLLAGLVFMTRTRREYRGASPNRLA
jgi:ABC-2 type transport system permease protein